MKQLNTLRFFLFLLIFFLFKTSLIGQCDRQKDSLILIKLYDVADGPNWLSNWDLSKTMDDWIGVKLNEDGCVTWLDIKLLDGVIPTELGDLTYLEILWLRNGDLRGEIPPELGKLNNLKQIDFSKNDLVGEIPSEIGSLSNLAILNLRFNELTGSIPAELGKLSQLTSLCLYSNELSDSIPSEIGNMVSLKNLMLYNNNLSGSIPSEIGNLSELHTLRLQSNQLVGEIPATLGKLNNLGLLDLRNNQLSGTIPPELGLLSNTYYFKLNNNQLTGNIPPEFKNLDSGFDLSSNNLEGCFPEELREHCPIERFTNNPRLPWHGEFAPFCNNKSQIGAPCDDGDPNTHDDLIQGDCSCGGTLVSVLNIEKGGSLNISPNPSSGTINFSGFTVKNVSAFNQLGQVVKVRFSKEEQSLEFFNTPDGIYFLEVETASKFFVKKVLLK